MVFWRPWVRALLGASGVTLLVPGGLILAVALAATLGGSGLGGLSQLVSGPQLPDGRSATVADSGIPGQDVPAIPGGTRPPRNATGHRTAGNSKQSARRPALGGGRQHAGKRRPSSPKHSPAMPKPSGPGTSPPSPAPGRPQPGGGGVEPVVQPVVAPVRSTLKRVGDAGQSLLKTIPVVGPPVADAVGTVVDLLSNPLPK